MHLRVPSRFYETEKAIEKLSTSSSRTKEQESRALWQYTLVCGYSYRHSQAKRAESYRKDFIPNHTHASRLVWVWGKGTNELIYLF